MKIRGKGRGGGGYSLIACLNHPTIDYASALSRRSTGGKEKGSGEGVLNIMHVVGVV